MRAEGKAGELLDAMELEAGNPQWSQHATIDVPKLFDLGITKSQSSHWQIVAN